MSDEDRQNLFRAHGLSEVEKGALLEISAIERKTGEFGEYGLARYATTLKNGARRSGSVRLNAKILELEDLKAPCVLMYDGLKVGGKQNKAYHDINVLVAPTLTAEELRNFADGLRKLTPSALLSVMRAERLSNFPPGTVVVFSNLQKRKLRKNAEDMLTLTYETVANGEERAGIMIVPARLEASLKEKGCGVFVYEGMRTSQLGRQYHDVNVLDESVIDYSQ